MFHSLRKTAISPVYCEKSHCGLDNNPCVREQSRRIRCLIGGYRVHVQGRDLHNCHAWIAQPSSAVLIVKHRCDLRGFVTEAGKYIISLGRRFGNTSKQINLVRRRVLNILLASMFLMPLSGHSGDRSSDEPDAAVAAHDQEAAIEERTLGATEERVKAQESVNALSGEIQALKQSVIALNKNLRVLEEDLLFPANTQVDVFLSLDVGKFFTLESVKLKLDGKVVASHIYTDKELQALAKGGMHKLHMANLSIGEHNLSAFFTGTGPSGRDYKRGTTLVLNKENGPKYVELKITDSSMKLQPEFSVREW